MEIRKASLEDASGVEALLEKAYPTLLAGAYDASTLSVALPSMMKAKPSLLGSGTFYVVVLEDRIVGCGGWTLEAPGSTEIAPGIAHLRHFATEPALGRQGIGTRIYWTSAHEAYAHGVRVFQAYSSLNAEPFYTKLGLRRIAQIGLAMGPIALPAILMEGSIELEGSSAP